MHQDQRIGLALGVLLIGACAALFFRNETRERPITPQLQCAEELDSRIAERSTRPYLSGVEAVEAADRARMRTVSDQTKGSDHAEDHATSIWSPVESFGKNDSSSGKGRGPFVESDGEVQELEPIPVPGDLPGGSVKLGDTASADSPGSMDRIRSKSGDTSVESQSHVVQKGETLSSIASKRLGNPGRFQEIFEANQDQLKDANDLRAGMMLRIPSGKSEFPGKVSAAHTDRDPSTLGISKDPQDGDTSETRPDRPAEPPQLEQRSPGRKFVPAKRFTPPARSTGPQAMMQDLIEEMIWR